MTTPDQPEVDSDATARPVEVSKPTYTPPLPGTVLRYDRPFDPVFDEGLLTARQAYLVMFEFLRQYHARGASDDIAGMLGGLSLLPDGNSADQAYLGDWDRAVQAVLTAESQPGGYQEANLTLFPRG